MCRLNQCRVCHEPVEFAFAAAEMMVGSREAFDYYECQGCGCLQIAQIPDDQTRERAYADSYYTQNQKLPRRFGRTASLWRQTWSRIRLRDARFLRAFSGRRYDRFDWFRLTKTGLHEPILDVGCGSGRLLYRMRAEGFEQLSGLDVHLGDALQHETAPIFFKEPLEDHDGQYRLVMAHHSFEHMDDPTAAFAAFSRLVEPGGHLLLRLPMADSWARRHYGANWVQLDAPRHLHLHTRRSIRLLAERSGFRISHVVDDSGPFQIWGSEAYRRGVSLHAAGPNGRSEFGFLERLSARRRGKKLSRQGLGDQACFYLERERDP